MQAAFAAYFEPLLPQLLHCAVVAVAAALALSFAFLPTSTLLPLVLALLPLLLWLAELHPLWAVPLLLVFGSYDLARARKEERALAIDIATSPTLLRSIARELPRRLHRKETDFQKAEWLNALLQQCWPSLSRRTETAVKCSLQPLLDKFGSHGRALGMPYSCAFSLRAADLGSKSPRVRGVRVLSRSSTGAGLSLEIDMKWSGDQLFLLQMSAVDGFLPPLDVSLSDVLVSAVLVLRLPPDCSYVALCLAEQPSIDFALKLANFDVTNIGMSSGGVVPEAELTVMKAAEFAIRRIIAATMLSPKEVLIPLLAAARGEDAKSGVGGAAE